ncbi:MAG TPA: hypothetical protein V6C72_01630, partial [Chroococcales cyanobacterium]
TARTGQADKFIGLWNTLSTAAKDQLFPVLAGNRAASDSSFISELVQRVMFPGATSAGLGAGFGLPSVVAAAPVQSDSTVAPAQASNNPPAPSMVAQVSSADAAAGASAGMPDAPRFAETPLDAFMKSMAPVTDETRSPATEESHGDKHKAKGTSTQAVFSREYLNTPAVYNKNTFQNANPHYWGAVDERPRFIAAAFAAPSDSVQQAATVPIYAPRIRATGDGTSTIQTATPNLRRNLNVAFKFDLVRRGVQQANLLAADNKMGMKSSLPGTGSATGNLSTTVVGLNVSRAAQGLYAHAQQNLPMDNTSERGAEAPGGMANVSVTNKAAAAAPVSGATTSASED